MRRVFWLAAFVIPLWVLRPAFSADDAITLDLLLKVLPQETAVERGLTRHPTIVKAKARVDQARVRLDEHKRWFRPKISLYAGERIDADRRRFGIQFSHDLDALWDRAPAREAEAELAIAEQELFMTQQAVVKEVSQACEACLLARMKAVQAAIHRDRCSQELDRGRNQYEEGLLSKERIAGLEKSLEEADHEIMKSSIEITQAILRLRQAMGEMGAPG